MLLFLSELKGNSILYKELLVGEVILYQQHYGL